MTGVVFCCLFCFENSGFGFPVQGFNKCTDTEQHTTAESAHRGVN